MTSNAPNIQLELRRTFDASCKQVFEVWTQPEFIGQWFGGGNINIADIHIDLQVGGQYRIRVSPAEAASFHIIGEYLEIIPYEKLMYTWGFDNAPPQEAPTLVTVHFKEINHRTEVILRHEHFPTQKIYVQHEIGWQDCFDRINAILIRQ